MSTHIQMANFLFNNIRMVYDKIRVWAFFYFPNYNDNIKLWPHDCLIKNVIPKKMFG